MQVTVSRIHDGKVELTQTGRTVLRQDEKEDDDDDEAKGKKQQVGEDVWLQYGEKEKRDYGGLSFGGSKKTGLGAVLGVLGFAHANDERAKVSSHG